MNYLKTHEPLKEDPSRLMPQARSLISVAVRYSPHPHPVSATPKALEVAKYAQGADYHNWLTERLTQLAEALRERIPGFEYLVASDSKPLLERDLAEQLGLGWIGKNTCLIHPKKGSFFLLGEILTNVEVTEMTAAATVPDFCGTCTRCLDACPTGALIEPRKLDATQCISYWTIETKEIAPEPLRSQIGPLFFGCDICQDVCPWNEKLFRLEGRPERPAFSESDLEAELRYFLTASNRQMERDLRESPILRARPRGLRRNALIVAGNQKIAALSPEIEKWTLDKDLGELAHWALQKISPSPAS